MLETAQEATARGEVAEFRQGTADDAEGKVVEKFVFFLGQRDERQSFHNEACNK